MTDPATGNTGLYDEPVPAANDAEYEDPNSPPNAPLNDPENYLAYVYWHILLDNMEVAFDEIVSITHGAFSAGSSISGGSQSAAFDYDATTVDHEAFTHDMGVEPFVLVAIGNNMLSPGYPVQLPGTTNGSARYVTPYVTATKVFLHEYRSRGLAGLGATTIDYRLLGFRPQRPAEGNVPPRLRDFDPATGLLTLGDGRWRNDRRYLQVVPGGTPFGLIGGRSLDLKRGAFRLARADGTTYDPIPPGTVKTGVVASGGEFASDTLVYGSAIEYDGDWTPEEIIQVQAP
jgi:hypothetical protein